RFAAVDFLREIDSLAARFAIIHIDGLDYRRRAPDGHPTTLSDAEVVRQLDAVEGDTTLDDFGAVIRHLSTIHPSRYVKLVEGLAAVGIRGVEELRSQTDALRLVAFVDRLYDARVRVLASGI